MRKNGNMSVRILSVPGSAILPTSGPGRGRSFASSIKRGGIPARWRADLKRTRRHSAVATGPASRPRFAPDVAAPLCRGVVRGAAAKYSSALARISNEHGDTAPWLQGSVRRHKMRRAMPPKTSPASPQLLGIWNVELGIPTAAEDHDCCQAEGQEPPGRGLGDGCPDQVHIVADVAGRKGSECRP